MKRRQLPDLRNARGGIEPKRLAKADAKPLGLTISNVAADPTTTELCIYDEIGAFWGISSQDVADALAGVSTPNLRVRINSPGGDVFEGIAIMNLLASWNGVVTGVVDALCASIATVIAMACESITMSPGSQMMIHPASGVCFGDEADMTQMAALLGFQTNNIAGLYAGRAGGDQADWLALMAAETWMTADEAVTAGLADQTGIVKQSGVTAAPPAQPDWDDMWDLTVYRFAGRAKAPAPAPAPVKANGGVVLQLNAVIDAEETLMALGKIQPQIDFLNNLTACNCGPKGYRMVAKDGQHLDACPARGTLTVRLVNVGVLYNLVSQSGNPCEEICEPLIDSGPFEEDDLPDIPGDTHPNCDCELEVAYGVDNKVDTHAPSVNPPSGMAISAESFRRLLEEEYA